MSYAQKKELSGNRTAAIIIVAVLQFVLGYALVTGLAFNVIKKAQENLKTFNVEQPPPPPEKPPPPPKETPQVPPPPMTPPSVVQPPIVQQPIQTVIAPPVLPPPQPIAPPAPPPPPPPRKTQSASPAKGDVRNLFAGVDYASEAGTEAEGTAQARLTIGTDGRVSSCSVVRSTGDSRLDGFVCRILRRAKFNPAKDSNGNATTDTYSTPPITFRLTG